MRVLNFTANQIWKRLTIAQKQKASIAYWTDVKEHENDPSSAVAALAKRYHLREKTIRNAKTEQLAKWTASLPECPETIVRDIVKCYLVSYEAAMIVEFLEMLSIPHCNCFIAEEFDLESLQPDLVRAAARKLCKSHESSSTDIYFGILLTQNMNAWRPLTDFVGLGTPSLESFAAPRATARELVEPGAEDLTNLDDVLILATVASVVGAEGALPQERVDDLIDEVVELNASRHKTLFNKGFADVIFGRSLAPHGRAENENRRRWYLCGAVVACARKADYARITSLYDSEEDIKAFGREAKPRSRKAAQFVFEALCHEGRPSAAADFLAPSMVAEAGLFDLLLEWGTRFLRAQEIDGAYALFDLLGRSIDCVAKEEREDLNETSYVQQRRSAHCLRLKGQFGSARKILQDVLQDPAAPERSATLTDIAIMNAGFRGLMEIVIPEKDLTSFIAKLDQIRFQLEHALEETGHHAHAQYCLGVLLVANQKDPTMAADLLEPSVSYMLMRGNAYDSRGLLSRSQFYLALSLAETLNPGHASRSEDLFTKAMESGFIPPAHLLKRFLEALLLTSPDSARGAAELAVRKLKIGKAVLDSLVESDVASDSEPVLRALLEWSCKDTRPAKQRFCDLKKVLIHAIRGQMVDVAERVLDEMEILARNGTCSQEFVDLLSDSDNFDPAWSSSDAIWAAAAVQETLGECREAAHSLRKEFYARIASAEPGASAEAENILECIRSYGLPDEELGDMEHRLGAVLAIEREAVVPAPASIPVCVTVVGGDEKQARYDDALRRLFEYSQTSIDLNFRHTNWSSNHGEQFEQMCPLLNRSDAVVVMRRIRTNLGRNVRRHCPVWIGCAGDSKSSIENAIRKAVTIARTRKAQNPLQTVLRNSA